VTTARAERPLATPGAPLAAAGALLCLTVVLLHDATAVRGGLGAAPASTRWTDWLELLVPHAVVALACAALLAARATRAGWTVGLLGSGLYLQGQGVHLAAVSSGRVLGDDAPIPLWHGVGQGVWWAGAALLVVALAAPRLPSPGRPRVAVPTLLVLGTVAMIATHWLRLLPLGYPAPPAVRYEDFVDLLTPYVVAGPLLAVLGRLGAPPRTWAAALLGTALFTQGQGLHLSANSIVFALGKQNPADLWDEHVGHHLWFAGLALLVLVVARRVRELSLPAGPLAYGLAALVALTWAANVVEGGAVPLGTALAAALAGEGWRTRDAASGRLLAGAFALSLLLVAAYGLWQGSFPQPSELGWL
jgi:hypothetical protein